MVIFSYQSHIWSFMIQTFHIGCLLCVEFCKVLLTLVDRFIMLPRSRSHTYHIHILLLHSKYAKIYHPFPPNKCSIFQKCDLSLDIFLIDETNSYAKVKKWKWWAHTSSWKKQEKMIAMSQNKKVEREIILRSIMFSIYHVPHTCTSWSKSMTLLSSDPSFGFTTYTR